MAIDFSKYIASVKDFPNKGIVFRDITPILQDGDLYRTATHELAEYAKSRNADVIVGPEARGLSLAVLQQLNWALALFQQESLTSCLEKLNVLHMLWNTVQTAWKCTRMLLSQVKEQLYVTT